MTEKTKRQLGRLRPSRISDNLRTKKDYTQALKRFSAEHEKNTNTAVVVHLFYTENWPLFRRKLKHLSKVVDFDLYLTIPQANTSFIDEIRKDFKGVQYLVCPNRGRDVLPFLNVAKLLDEWGYVTVLKFHSKKSTHWDGGQSWLENMLDQIIPDDNELLKEIIKVMDYKDTGVVGPKEFYYPLTVNFPANGPHLSRFIVKHYGHKKEKDYLQINRKKYGFFGGTMIWMRLDAVRKVLNFRISDFEPEFGQVDGTYAHAVERLFCIIPEIEQRVNYSCDANTVRTQAYSTDNIPSWSQDHTK